MSKAIDLKNKKINMLTGLYICGKRRGRRENIWMFLCDCGNKKEILGSSVNSGRTQSCGCLQKIRVSEKNRGKKPERSLPPGEGALNRIWYQYTSDAKRRGYTFELTKLEFKDLTKLNCFYCNGEPKAIQTKWSLNFNSAYEGNGVDRVNNDLGYSKENCVPCCRVCNSMKREYGLDFFINHIIKIYTNKNKF